MSERPRHNGPERPQAFRRWLWSGVLAAALVAGLPPTVLVLAALLPPDSSAFALIGSVVWPVVGPHLVLLSLIALTMSCMGFLRGPRSLAVVALSISVVAFVGSAILTGQIIRSIHAAGGTVSLPRALWLTAITAGEPDLTETFATKDGKELRASLFLPNRPENPAPILLYIHGGGFMTGTRLETAADLAWFAERGWLAISVDYRLWTEGNPTWDKAPGDVACALVWVHENAERLGGDATRLALLGDSAGGNLAINLAYAAALGRMPSDCGDGVPAPQAVVVQYPAVDPLALYEDGYPIPGFEPQMLATGYLGGRPEEAPDRVRAVTSSTYLSENAPPTLIIEPESDVLVPSASVYAFAEEARAAGVDLELVRIPHANHIYNQIAANSLGNQGRLTITKQYLVRRGLAPETAIGD